MKKIDNFDPSKWLVENKITTQSRLNENESGTPSDGMHSVILSYIRPDARDKYLKDYKKYYTLLNVQAKPIGGSPKPQAWMDFLNKLIKDGVVSKDDLITFSERYNHSGSGLEGLATYLFKQGDPDIIQKIDNLSKSNLNEDALSQEKQMVFKDITQMMNQELTSGESTHDALVKLRDFISNLLESDF